MDIPALGYPISADAIAVWFRDRYGRQPLETEVGAIMLAMTERDATPPREGPVPDLEGFHIDPGSTPATRG